MNLLEEFRDRTSVLANVHYSDAGGRVGAILEWLDANPITKAILDELRQRVDIPKLVQNSPGRRMRPKTNTPAEVAAVGLYLADACQNGKRLYDLCFLMGISPPYQTSSVQEHSNAGLNDYVVPFLVFVEKELVKRASEYSADSIAEDRFVALLTSEVREIFPKTLDRLEQISPEFLRPDAEVLWQNIGNSCRQLLIEFSHEIISAAGLELPPEIKDSDVKSTLRHVLSKIAGSGRFKDTLEGLSVGVWDHTQSILHRPSTSKAEAMRAFLWTAMLVSEYTTLVRTYNES